jgi:hypothetical protein
VKKLEHYVKLFDVYKKILKIDEINIFSDYYEEDLSMQEIADNLNISKSAVGKKIKNIENKLDAYENSLNVLKNNEILQNLLEEDNIKIIKEKISIILET